MADEGEKRTESYRKRLCGMSLLSSVVMQTLSHESSAEDVNARFKVFLKEKKNTRGEKDGERKLPP